MESPSAAMLFGYVVAVVAAVAAGATPATPATSAVASAAITSSDLRPAIVPPPCASGSPPGACCPVSPSPARREGTKAHHPRGEGPSVAPPASRSHGRGAERLPDLLDGLGLARAHDLVVLAVGVRDLVRHGQDEP